MEWKKRNKVIYIEIEKTVSFPPHLDALYYFVTHKTMLRPAVANYCRGARKVALKIMMLG